MICRECERQRQDKMPPIDPRFMKAKRFPVHAAVILCQEAEVARLVDPDAKFHLGRKMPDTEVSVLHVACSARPGPGDVMLRIVKYLIKVGIIGLGWSNRILS